MKSKFFYFSLLHFFNDGFSAALVLFLPFIALDMHLNLSQVGVLGMGLNLLPIVVAMPAIFFAQKFGSYKIVLGALLLYGVGYLLAAAAVSFFYLFIVFLFIGIGFGLFHPIGFSVVSRLSDNGNIGKNIGNFTAWGDAGRIIVTGGVSFLAVALSWRFTAFIYGAVVLLFFAYIYFFHFRKRYLTDEKSSAFHDHKFSHLLQSPKFLAVLACCAFDNLASSPLFLFLPFLLLSKHINPAFLSSFAGAFLVGNMLGKATMGRWADKSGSARVFILAELVMAVLIVGLIFANTVWLIAALAIALGVATRGTVPATRSLVYAAVAESGNFERANSLVEIGNVSAAAAAPLILGIVSNSFGVAMAFWLCAGFAVLAVIPAIIFSLIKNPPKSEGGFLESTLLDPETSSG